MLVNEDWGFFALMKNNARVGRCLRVVVEAVG